MEHSEEHHQHGTMDISQNEKTFEGFVKFTTRAVIFLAILLIFLAAVL